MGAAGHVDLQGAEGVGEGVAAARITKAERGNLSRCSFARSRRRGRKDCGKYCLPHHIKQGNPACGDGGVALPMYFWLPYSLFPAHSTLPWHHRHLRSGEQQSQPMMGDSSLSFNHAFS